MKKLTEIYHMDIYTDSGQYIGDVQDIILDLEKREVTRLLTIPWKSAKNNVNNSLKQNSIIFRHIKSIGNVIIVAAGAKSASENAASEEVTDLS
ncbi:MAG: PRC-barrel domain-containing protein [Candidatus Micrarchaeia archaeon]